MKQRNEGAREQGIRILPIGNRQSELGNQLTTFRTTVRRAQSLCGGRDGSAGVSALVRYGASMSWSDFAVILRAMGDYTPILAAVFERHDIPLGH